MVVLEGSGSSVIGNDTIEWQPNDVISIPHWHWHSHTALSETAEIFMVTDEPLLSAVGYSKNEYR